jgi:hypothetical protein
MSVCEETTSPAAVLSWCVPLRVIFIVMVLSPL